jgi:nascent polypeptide-associated complex subunit alpha
MTMFPGGKINPKMMKQAMKRMGIQQNELEGVQEVIIRFSDKELVIKPASVSKVNAMGGVSWQVEGQATERKLDTTPDISEDDVKTVMDQAGCDEVTARHAIDAADGDLAIAIMALAEAAKEE